MVISIDPATTHGFEIYPIPLGDYIEVARHRPFDADAEAAQIVRLLNEEFGGLENVWQIPPAERDAAAVHARLQRWARPGKPGRSSVLVWLGHGVSNDSEAWLVVRGGEGATGDDEFLPQQMALQIRKERVRQQHIDGQSGWTIIVIEACGARRFIDLTAASLLQAEPNINGVLLIGSGESLGQGYLAAFREALQRVLHDYRQYNVNDTSIGLSDLASRMEHSLSSGGVMPLHLGRAAIPRRSDIRVISTLDMYAEVSAALVSLPAREREYFAAKGMASDFGEHAWNFVGRQREVNYIAHWAHRAPHGMLIVTGKPGTGKSAILGNLWLRTNPAVWDILVRRSLLELPEGEEDDAPGSLTINLTLPLTGASVFDVSARLLQCIGAPAVYSGSVGDLISAVVKALEAKGQALLILADGLDEARDPLPIAKLLRAISRAQGIRVIIGTRVSMLEGPDQPETPDDSLVVALGRDDEHVIQYHIERDIAAIETYVRNQLSSLLDTDYSRNSAALDEIVMSVSATDPITDRGREFLFARLAVHTILNSPDLLRQDNAEQLARLLTGDHKALFAYAVERISAATRNVWPLLRALSFMHGRGLPRADGVWATLASAISEVEVTEDEINIVLQKAAPYILLDGENGQSVYRLAHRTFLEYFQSLESGSASHACQRAIYNALIEQAAASGGWMNAPPYVASYIVDHALDASALDLLLEDTDFLAHGDLVRLRQALATFSPEERTPIQTLVLRVGNQADAIGPARRLELLALAAVSLGMPEYREKFTSVTDAALRLRWAQSFGQPHQALTGHLKAVSAMALGQLDTEFVLASGDIAGSVRLWNAKGDQVGEMRTGHTSGVGGIILGRLGGRDVLVTSSRWTTAHIGAKRDVRLWDRHGHLIRILTDGVDIVPTVMGRFSDHDVIVTGDFESFQIWDEDCEPIAGLHTTNGSLAAAALGRLNHKDVIVTASGDREGRGVLPLQIWHAPGEPARPLYVPHGGDVAAVAVGTFGRHSVVVTGCADGIVRVFDEQGQPILRTQRQGHSPVSSVVLAHVASEDIVVARRWDGSINIWNERGEAVCDPLTSFYKVPQRHDMQAVTAGKLEGRNVVACGNNDGTVRIWDYERLRESQRAEVDPLGVNAVAVGRFGGQEVIAAAGADSGLRLWSDRGALVRVLDERTNSGREYVAVAAGQYGNSNIIAAIDSREFMRIWPDDVWRKYISPRRPRLRFHLATHAVAIGRFAGRDALVYNFNWQLFCILAGGLRSQQFFSSEPGFTTLDIGRLGGRNAIVAGSKDGKVRVWGEQKQFLTFSCHGGAVTCVTIGSLRNKDVFASASEDGTIRVWDENGNPALGSVLRHSAAVVSVVIGRLGGRDVIASIGDDKELRVWDEFGTMVGEPVALLETPRALALHSCGLVVVVANTLCFFEPSE